MTCHSFSAVAWAGLTGFYRGGGSWMGCGLVSIRPRTSLQSSFIFYNSPLDITRRNSVRRVCCHLGSTQLNQFGGYPCCNPLDALLGGEEDKTIWHHCCSLRKSVFLLTSEWATRRICVMTWSPSTCAAEHGVTVFDHGGHPVRTGAVLSWPEAAWFHLQVD